MEAVLFRLQPTVYSPRAYMLRCADQSFYVGHTDNLEARIAQHHQGFFRTCYTYKRRPVTLVFSQDFPSRMEALTMERKIKGWNRAKKTALIQRDGREISRIARFKYMKDGSGVMR